MSYQIRFISPSSSAAKGSSPKCLAILSTDNWDDFSFKTMFSLSIYDENGKHVQCGSVKIGFKGQAGGRTSEALQLPLEQLPENFFSLGQDVEYYKTIHNELSEEFGASLLRALRDVVFDRNLLLIVASEKSFETSLTRDLRMSVIEGQFKRVLNGGAPLTDFKFSYRDPGSEKTAAIDLSFDVKHDSKPPTNIHVLIGRNGVGKTTLLNNMTRAIVKREEVSESAGSFYVEEFFSENPMPEDFFTAVVSVSFSAFDPFRPFPDRSNRNDGIAYFYIGMKRVPDGPDEPVSLKSHADLCADFLKSLTSCFSVAAKKARWIAAIRRLESDDNFAEMELTDLAELEEVSAVKRRAKNRFERMSSGHAIVLLTMTRLVDTVDEKTLVLMDEPESHLHPPLLSAFTRALSELLSNRNGVAIIATHSPVVVQEVPRSCVWTMERSRAEGTTERPELETFGENVGVLTREIFGLEVTRSGFHDLLRRTVEQGKTFEEIVQEYKGRLGFEAQALLRAMVVSHAAAAAAAAAADDGDGL
jgi:predicted ATPase